MNKELKYQGYSASPGDRETPEGDLAVAMNLIPEHNTIRPVLPPKQILQLGSTGRAIKCIHRTSVFSHYITIDSNGKMQYFVAEPLNLTTVDIYTFTAPVRKVEPVGNSLVVLADDGVHYLLWSGNGYEYLGQHIPELDISFSLGSGLVQATSQQIRKSAEDSEGVSWEDCVENDHELGDEKKPYYNNILHGTINKLIAEEVTGKGRFCEPFFVRYALRMYDDSLVMHSAPILMLPQGLNVSTIEDATDEDFYVINVTAGASRLEYECIFPANNRKWKDLITSVDIFISAPLYTYDQAKDVDKVMGSIYKLKHINKGTVSMQDAYTAGGSGIDVVNNTTAIPQHPVESWQQSVRDCSNFYLLKSIKFDEFLTYQNRQEIIIPDDYLQSLVTRDAMTDGYHTHDSIAADVAFAYNNRVNLGNVVRTVYSGFPLYSAFCRSDDGDINSSIYVELVQDGRTIIVKSQARGGNYNLNALTYYFYPDPSAKRAWISCNGNWYVMPMQPHVGLNGAYWFNLDGPESYTGDAPIESTDKTIAEPNKIYTSEANNPFYFPLLGINSIGQGKVMGLCSAVRPVSTSQFGYADLYIFGSSGLWVAKINEKGTYNNIDLVSGDICLNADSITQMETTVLFTTARGIMLVSGSQVQCISEVIDDDGQPFGFSHSVVNTMFEIQYNGMIAIAPFKTFLGGCRFIYDYKGQHIIAYNPSHFYSYIYSLESNKWGMMRSNIAYSVKDYPKALAVTTDGRLVNYSDVDVLQGSALQNQLLITRPLSLDLPDVHKTIREVLQRGYFGRYSGRIQAVLFASNDLQNWFAVTNSSKENLRGTSGTGYKWYRIGLMMSLNADESISSCSIVYEQRYTNRLR